MVNPDGTLWTGKRYLELRAPVNRSDSGDRMSDRSGRPAFHHQYVGIQMFDATRRLGGVVARQDHSMALCPREWTRSFGGRH